MKKKKEEMILVSNNEEASIIIDSMKANSRYYSRLISALNLLGDFPNIVNVEIYDIKESKKEKKIRMWCEDQSNNIFVFYGESSDRKDLLKIIKETNEDVLEYDIGLAKKFPINEENIEFARAGKEMNTKFGRLISDEKGFCSLFLGDNIGYQIKGDFDGIDITRLFIKINGYTAQPGLIEFLQTAGETLLENNNTFNYLEIMQFKYFNQINYLTIGNNNAKDKSKVLIKNNKK